MFPTTLYLRRFHCILFISFSFPQGALLRQKKDVWTFRQYRLFLRNHVPVRNQAHRATATLQPVTEWLRYVRLNQTTDWALSQSQQQVFGIRNSTLPSIRLHLDLRGKCNWPFFWILLLLNFFSLLLLLLLFFFFFFAMWIGPREMKLEAGEEEAGRSGSYWFSPPPSQLLSVRDWCCSLPDCWSRRCRGSCPARERANSVTRYPPC